MLRVLTLSTLFPDKVRPGFGGFVERQTLGLAAHPEVDLRVVVPVAVPPLGLARWHAAYRDISRLPHRENWKGLDVHRPQFLTLPLIGGRINPASMWWTLIPILDAMRQDFPFDVIDAEFFYPDGPTAIWLGRRYGVPVSIKARGSDIHVWGENAACRPMIVAAGQAADGMLAVSVALRNDMIAMGLPGDRIKVHHTGVDQAMFRLQDRAAAKAALGINGPLVVNAANLVPRKGQALVIEAMRSLPEASLLIAGRGPEHARLNAQIAARGLQGRVRLLGALPHDRLPSLFAAADVVVLTSVSEGLANVWVEALACGTPIVISDVGGAREVVDRPAAGRLVDQTPEAIAAGIRDVLANPSPPDEVAEPARNFTWERNTSALYAHLTALVAARRA